MQIERNEVGKGWGACTAFTRRGVLFGVTILALATLAGSALPQATSFNYTPGQLVIKAAVLSIDPATPNPNLMVGAGIMEGLRRASFKPPRWDIINPRGGSGLTTYIPEGSPDYWNVILTPGEHTDLSGYHLLYLCTDDITGLDAFQVDSLLEAVNEGAVLWIDVPKDAGMVTGPPGSGTPWQDAPFFFGVTADSYLAHSAITNHALVTRPFCLTLQHIRRLGVQPPPGVAPCPNEWTWDVLDISTNANLQPLLIGDECPLDPAAPGPFATIAVAGRYGSGGFVVTAGDVGSEIARWTDPLDIRWDGDGSAATPVFLSDPRPEQAADVMFGYNVIAWATGWTQSRQAARGAGASLGELRAEMDVKWQSPDIGAVASSPVIDEAGRVFVLSYAPNPTLYCFDSDPGQDLDGDGLADDGIPDYLGETSADLIWSYPLPAGLTPRSSSPATARAMFVAGAAGSIDLDVVLFSAVDPSGGDGSVTCLNAVDGALLWTSTIAGYGGSDVVTLSTPVIHNSYVYVLSSEYAAGGPGPNPWDNAYGRVHCLDIAAGGVLPTGFAWHYPEDSATLTEPQFSLPPVDDPEWVANSARSLLPPVPTPTPSICNTARYQDTGALDPHLNAVVYFGTPTSFVYDASLATPAQVMVPQGADFALVPTPLGDGGAVPTPDPFAANRNHYRVRLDVSGPTAVSAAEYVYEGVGGTETAAYSGAAPTIVGPYAQYAPDEVREFLAGIPAASASTNYYDVQAGCRVHVTYTASGTRHEFDYLPGPVLFRRPHDRETNVPLTSPPPDEWVLGGQRRAGGPTISGDILTAALTVSFDGDGSSLASGYDLPGRAGAIVGLDPATGVIVWKYDPQGSPGGIPAPGIVLPTGPARVHVDGAPADAGDVIVGVSSQEISDSPPDTGCVGQVFGLDPRPDVTIRVRLPIPAGHSTPSTPLLTKPAPQLWLIDGTIPGNWDAAPATFPEIDPSCYEVDYVNRTITFPAEKAHNVLDTTGVARGPVYGKMLIVTFNCDVNDPVTPDDPSDDTYCDGTPAFADYCVYGVPDLARWQYIAGMIRLRHHPVALSGGATALTMTLANGVLVTGWTPGEAVVTACGIDWLPTGLIDMSGAVFVPSDPPPGGLVLPPVQRGAEVLVSYSACSLDGPVSIPNAYAPRERHQVPYSFGRAVGGVAVANGGRTIVIGTESLNLDADLDLLPDAGPDVGGYSPTGAVPDPQRTLLALSWDKVSNFVRGLLLRPVNRSPLAPGVPVVSSSPAVNGDTVVISSRDLAAISNRWSDPPGGYEGIPAGAPSGHASALSPVRTVITDNQRIVETVGGEPDWVCTGTRSLDAAWLNTDAALLGGYPDNVPVFRMPFNRPAKAFRLGREHFLTTYVTRSGAVQRYKYPIYPPEPAVIPPPLGIPEGTPWPPADSGIRPGNYLIVDTGNNRVVEVDRQGRLVWPLANYPLTAPANSRRDGDRLGFDFYTSPYNGLPDAPIPPPAVPYCTPLDLKAPTDAHRFMAWNYDTGIWEMHTVIADSGNYRVLDVITTFTYDPSSGSVLQQHEVVIVTPPQVRVMSGPRRGEYVRVSYTKAQPLFHPYDGSVIGYLCAAENLHELLVVEAGSMIVNPVGTAPLPCLPSTPAGNNGTWALWSWLYDMDLDGNPDTIERLTFDNIRHMEVSRNLDYADANGDGSVDPEPY
ncbi:MAG: hypothetical protein ACUVX8_11030, partial [Candidatus Zipacnadales bacterium]